MSLSLTLILIATALGLALFAGWRGARPWDIRRGPRMMPWRFLMVMSAAAVMLLAIHLAVLLGAPSRPPV